MHLSLYIAFFLCFLLFFDAVLKVKCNLLVLLLFVLIILYQKEIVLIIYVYIAYSFLTYFFEMKRLMMYCLKLLW